MDKTNSVITTLDKIDAGIIRMKEHSAAVRWFLDADNPFSAYDKALKLAAQAEKTTLLTRVLPAYTGNPRCFDDMEVVKKESIPVEVGFTTEGYFCVRMPALLPKKESGTVDYIRGYMYPALKRFFDGKNPVRYRDCVLVFRHVNSRDRPERRMRDHDNYEVNAVADIIALYVLPDDHPKVASHYYCSAEGPEDRTEIYVVPKHDFPMWFVEEKTLPDKGVKLYENIICGA